MLPEQRAAGLHLLQQGLQIGLDHKAPAGHVVADEGAIAALGRAEGDAEIKLRLAGEKTVLRPDGIFRRPAAEPGPVFRNIIMRPQILLQRGRVHPLPNGQTGGLCGLDAGHAAPGGLLLQQGQQRLIYGGLHRIGQRPLIFLPVGLRRDGNRRLSLAPANAPEDLRPGAEEAVLLPGGAAAAVAGEGLHPVVGLVRQQGDQHLLNTVVPVVALQTIVHRRIASFI